MTDSSGKSTSAAALAEQRRELQVQMERQRASIARSLNVASQTQAASSPYPRSKTVRFIKGRFAGIDRLATKALTALVMSRLFGRGNKKVRKK